MIGKGQVFVKLYSWLKSVKFPVGKDCGGIKLRFTFLKRKINMSKPNKYLTSSEYWTVFESRNVAVQFYFDVIGIFVAQNRYSLLLSLGRFV